MRFLVVISLIVTLRDSRIYRDVVIALDPIRSCSKECDWNPDYNKILADTEIYSCPKIFIDFGLLSLTKSPRISCYHPDHMTL